MAISHLECSFHWNTALHSGSFNCIRSMVLKATALNSSLRFYGGETMKKWLKKYGRWLVVGLEVLFIGNIIYVITTADAEWKVTLQACVITIWVWLMLIASGVMSKLYEWWDRD